MRIEIQNIGKIKEAKIDLNGITIITGMNNQGKSTIGKTLFALLHDMDGWGKTYQEIQKKKIDKFLHQQSLSLENYCMKISGLKRPRVGKVNQMIKQYSENEDFFVAIEDAQVQAGVSDLRQFLVSYAMEYCSLYLKESEIHTRDFDNLVEIWINSTLSKINEIEFDELELQKVAIQTSFENVFRRQYRKIGTKESKLVFTNDLLNIPVHISISDSLEMDRPIRLYEKVHYLEGSILYDLFSEINDKYVPCEYLQYLMRPNTVIGNIPFQTDSTFEEKEYNQQAKITSILKEIHDTIHGSSDFYPSIGFSFQENGIDETIHTANISSGIKALAILEYGLRTGVIRKNDILILDTTEANLHPQWQMIYANVLVQICKSLGIKVLLITHSPCFINAILSSFSTEEQTQNINLYQAVSAEDGVTFQDLSTIKT